MDKNQFNQLFKKAINDYAQNNLYSVSDIPAHQHTGVDSLQIDYSDLVNKLDYIVYRIVAPTTNTSVANKVGGDYVMPYNGYITSVGATVDTAGITGDTTIDVLKNGTSIMSTKITINTTKKTSRTATTQPILGGDVSFKIGDIITFNVTTISTTPAQGLSMFLNTIITT